MRLGSAISPSKKAEPSLKKLREVRTGFKIKNSFCSEFPHKFVERLSETVTVTEDGKVELEVTVEDESAEVGWFHEDTEIKTEKSRSGLNADGKEGLIVLTFRLLILY